MQASRQRLGEHVAGEPALGVSLDAPAHQLERHDRDGLSQHQSLEVAHVALLGQADQPGLGRAALALGDREHHGLCGAPCRGRVRSAAAHEARASRARSSDSVCVRGLRRV